MDSASPIGPAVVEEAIEKLLETAAEYDDDGFHVLTTREDGQSCSDSKAPVLIPLKVRCRCSKQLILGFSDGHQS